MFRFMQPSFFFFVCVCVCEFQYLISNIKLLVLLSLGRAVQFAASLFMHKSFKLVYILLLKIFSNQLVQETTILKDKIALVLTKIVFLNE